MIDSLASSLVSATSAGSSASSQSGASSTSNTFDAALEAERKDAERKQALQGDLDEIREKGFSAWAKETQEEALREKLRQKIMAEMGVDEQSLSSLSSVMRETLEQKIEEEVQKRMEEEMAKVNDQGGTTQAQTAMAQQTSQTGRNDRSGKDVPVIPAVSWPGAASLF